MKLGQRGQHCQQYSGAPNLSSFQSESVQAALADRQPHLVPTTGAQHCLGFQAWTWARRPKGVEALDFCIKSLLVHPPLTSDLSSDNKLSPSFLRPSSSHPDDVGLSASHLVKTQSVNPCLWGLPATQSSCSCPATANLLSVPVVATVNQSHHSFLLFLLRSDLNLPLSQNAKWALSIHQLWRGSSPSLPIAERC